MAKISKRLVVKGLIDYENKRVIEFDKDKGEIEHKFEDIFLEFNGLDDVTLTLSHDKVLKVD